MLQEEMTDEKHEFEPWPSDSSHPIHGLPAITYNNSGCLHALMPPVK